MGKCTIWECNYEVLDSLWPDCLGHKLAYIHLKLALPLLRCTGGCEVSGRQHTETEKNAERGRKRLLVHGSDGLGSLNTAV